MFTIIAKILKYRHILLPVPRKNHWYPTSYVMVFLFYIQLLKVRGGCSFYVDLHYLKFLFTISYTDISI